MADQPQQWTEEQKRQYYEQYRKQYAQYYQQQAQYRQQPQPQQPPRQPRKKGNKIVNAMLIIIGVLVLLILYIAITQMGAKDTQPPAQEGLKIDANGVVLSEGNLTLRSPAYYVDEDVIVYTTFSDIKNVFEDEEYNILLTYGIKVFNSQGQEITAVSNDKLSTINQGYEYPVKEYHFTAKIMTLNMVPGEYRIVSTVRDELGGTSQTAEQKITLSKPDTVRVSGPYFADITETSFQHRGNNYEVGDEIQMMAQIRGFAKEDGKANVDLNLEVMDGEGYLQPLMSNYNLYKLSNLTSPEQDVFSMNVFVGTKDIKPGVYWFKITARDSLAGTTHSNIRYAVIQ